MDKTILKDIGMLDAEAEIYLALLRLGDSLVSKLHKETGLHRTHIYDLLEKLREKGLVSIYIQSGKKVFKASNPNKLLQYLNDKKDRVSSLLPKLNSLMNVDKEDTSVELFKGKEGLKTILLDILNTKKDFFVFGKIKIFEEVLEFALPNFLKRTEKLGIKETIISNNEENFIRIKYGKYRFLSDDFLFPSSFVVYGNKVAIFIWSLPYFAILINNKEVAHTYQSYFDFFWSIAKPLKSL